MLNLGTKVKLKKLGEIVVREPSFESLMALSREVLSLVQAFTGMSGIDPQQVVVVMLSDPATAGALREIAAACTERDPGDFLDMPFTDSLKIAVAVKETVDWMEVKELFIRLLPPVVLQKVQGILGGSKGTKEVGSPDSSTLSPPSTVGPLVKSIEEPSTS